MHSPLSAVVVRFSRARKRYERQGILVSEVALEQAEAGCLAGSESRAFCREHDAGATRLIGSRVRRSNDSGELSQNIRRAGAAEGSEAQLPASRSGKKHSPLPQSRTLAPVTATMKSF